jgi:hypothetical protein
MTVGRIPSVEGGIQPTIVDAKGDLIAATAADSVTRLVAGANETRLVADSAEATGLKYVADTTNYAVAAKGDLLVGTAADTLAALTVGANDTVLTADSTTATGLKWATPSSGGMTLISTTTLSGSSVTLSSIPQTYVNLMIIIKNYRPVNDNTLVVVRVNGDSATRYASGSGSFGSTSWSLSGGADNGTSQAFCITNIYNYSNTVTWKTASALAWVNDDGTPANVKIFNSPTLSYNQTSAITSLDFFTNSGNFTSGTVELYGVK